MYIYILCIYIVEHEKICIYVLYQKLYAHGATASSSLMYMYTIYVCMYVYRHKFGGTKREKAASMLVLTF